MPSPCRHGRDVGILALAEPTSTFILQHDLALIHLPSTSVRMSHFEFQIASVSTTAPTRIADLGGWTDTWFARHGVVCHLAVWPGVDVRVAPAEGPPGVNVQLHNFDRVWHWSAGTPPQACPDPLIAACLDEAEVPDGAWHLEVTSRVPPGASMGTSASVCVAMLAALDSLRQRMSETPAAGTAANRASAGADGYDRSDDAAAELARRAHRIETVRLAQQSGIQDQWAAAAGGVGLVEMDAYPDARRTELAITPATRTALDAQWLVVLLPRGHDSSAVHADVVQALAHAGPEEPRLVALRRCAREGAAALRGGDLVTYGRVLIANTEVQASLHASIVNDEAAQLIDVVRGPDTLGWKVNGAGGSGGSLSVLAASADARARLVARVAAACPWATVLDVRLAEGGVRVGM